MFLAAKVGATSATFWSAQRLSGRKSVCALQDTVLRHAHCQDFSQKNLHIDFEFGGFLMLGYFLDIVCFQTARISLLGGKSASKYQCKTFIICVWFQLSEKSTESSLSNMPHGSQCGDIPTLLLAVEEVDSPFMNILGPSQSCQGVSRTRIVVMR